jgi:hypothetical protein
MEKFVPGIGEADFRTLRECSFGFVDKSLFVRDVLADGAKVLLFPRPRRFGKTLNLSMLDYFLRKRDENLLHLFGGLMVTHDARAMKHFQKYPTIFITFKDVKFRTAAEAMRAIRELVVAVYRENRVILQGNSIDSYLRDDLQKVLDGNVTDGQLASSLLWLSQALHAFHGERVLILIDEYDTPLHAAYLNGYFDEIMTFFKTFLSAGLKDNKSLFKGVMTGILRVAKENMFSDLNHIKVCSIIDKKYATAFGFTDAEVAGIVDGEQLEDVRKWYNGYIFGGEVIYNPWSVINYLERGVFQPYWVNTASTDLIERLAFHEGMALSDHSTALLTGGTVDIRVDSRIVLRDIETQPAAFWNFMLFSGYLTPRELELDDGEWHAKLAIPNQELRIVYRDLFQGLLSRWDPSSEKTTLLVKGLLSGDAQMVQDQLQRILVLAMSYHDTAGREPEKLYHGIMLGMLVHLDKQYEIRSNREAGFGRADIWMRPKKPGNPGVVLEFKVLNMYDTVENVLRDGAKQVREKQYAADVSAAGATEVYEYVMAFEGKNAWVRRIEA